MPLSGGTRFYPAIERRGFGGVIEFVEAADRLEQFEDPLRFLFVDPRESEADVDQHVIANLRFRHVFETIRLLMPPNCTFAIRIECSWCISRIFPGMARHISRGPEG